jgi:hypothetical protein
MLPALEPAVGVGDRFPALALQCPSGKPTTLVAAMTVVVFFRGHW